MPAKRGAGRPKFKKPTLESFLNQVIDKRARIVFDQIVGAYEGVKAIKGRREAQMVMDAFFISDLKKLPVKHYSSFLRVCKDKIKSS